MVYRMLKSLGRDGVSHDGDSCAESIGIQKKWVPKVGTTLWYPLFFSEPINRLFRAPVEIGFGDSDRSRSSDSEHALMSLRSLVVLEKSSRKNPMPNWDCFEKRDIFFGYKKSGYQKWVPTFGLSLIHI